MTKMSNNINRNNRWVPIIIAVSIIAGIIIGTFFANRFAGNRLNIINTSSNKLNDLLHIIDDQYVDTVNIVSIVEQSMPKILEELDPHSTYISAKNAQTANEDLKGSFSGVGVQFVIREDTVRVTGIIKGGPSEKVGILAGDKIIAVDDSPYVGKIVTNEETLRRLKGEKGTQVKIGVARHGHDEPLSFTVVRGDIPLKSIDATYMINKELGYVKIKNFGETTYAELLIALAELEVEGFKGLVVDLRENGGGYLSAAIQMVNEFLPKDRLIVYTQGRRTRREEFRSDGRGAYQDLPIIVLIDERTASAAEIFSGAIQDNDRGIIVGRRSFGKGLVQQPIEFSDGSLIHLTIARYYTPSGRCIQKPYVKGQPKEYDMDLITRYERGEFFNQDSIHQTGEAYTTSIGRTVYGGGGIMPDYFVAEDTTALTPYYTECVTQGTIAQFCFEYTDNNREKLNAFQDAAELEKHLRKQRVVDQFIRYADKKSIKRRNNMIIKSQHLFEQAIYGSIIYNMLEMNDYVQYLNHDDITLKKAIDLFKAQKTKPTLDGQTTDKSQDSSAKKTAYNRGTMRVKQESSRVFA